MIQLACPSEYAALAHRRADSARPIIRKYFRPRLDIVSKADNSPVTIANRTAEIAMRKLVSAKFPEHGIRGEEYGVENPDADWCWVFDPIDGTQSFISGSLCVGTQIVLKYQTVLGLIDQPITEEHRLPKIHDIPTTATLLDCWHLEWSICCSRQTCAITTSCHKSRLLRGGWCGDGLEW